MKERPILFSGPMVRAILEGRKTQTRRVMKPAYINNNLYSLHEVVYGNDAIKLTGPHDRAYAGFSHPSGGSLAYYGCPYGQPGDRLWVRESWQVLPDKEYTLTQPEYEGGKNPSHIIYRASDEAPEMIRWRPSIHMPRWASRITLEVTGVRVERVQDISEAEAVAEGIERQIAHGQDLGWRNYLWHGDFGSYGLGNKKSDSWDYQYSTYQKAQDCFSSLWELINGKKPGRSWNDNPWVWVIEFKRIDTTTA